MNRILTYFLVISIFLIFALTAGCRKKSIEDTESYKEYLKHQEATEKKLDSIRQDNYRQLSDTVNNNFKRQLDSLKRSTDSLEKELEKSIENLKQSK